MTNARLVWYLANIGVMVNHRLELRREGRLQEELYQLSKERWGRAENEGAHSSVTKPTPLPVDATRPGQDMTE
ncbi:hypothetical protein BZG36_01271 [Bifiguratus adelaidae]|uniref:Uncharacterized protein n=1 Tax=Bifiguratus adelaidae TaxID=1938954 RepID=A0A261Y598_9FUNG|nr:hypothetical protein BZG36_01271 [Bifiguratus adelaidae]